MGKKRSREDSEYPRKLKKAKKLTLDYGENLYFELKDGLCFELKKVFIENRIPTNEWKKAVSSFDKALYFSTVKIKDREEAKENLLSTVGHVRGEKYCTIIHENPNYKHQNTCVQQIGESQWSRIQALIEEVANQL
eukprot:CAMPEP_0119121618 /NCGR_PEP_ID=MMETSP1310-20130426/2167_1 /TAXON_ID=464262 /ORGANISM="Genus nov. species nov., Strain RCC2339" /LENGTH=135 /DNA_ID=CAMNT_0007111191 /DNA_START=1 /DNA_END=408 /DNA_ORIENTATION=+